MLKATRLENETWRETCERYGKAYGLEYESLRAFDAAIEKGVAENDACLQALGEWDLLDFDDEPETVEIKDEGISDCCSTAAGNFVPHSE